MTQHIRILGTRGVPAAHGGFETFAEKFALYLVERGHRVTVYCQIDIKPGEPTTITEDTWRGVRRINIPVSRQGPVGTIEFDWKSIMHARKEKGVCLELGYNTAAFLVPLRLSGHPIITNMDGLEWKRSKWSMPVRVWFYIQEWIGALVSHKLIADHPAIADHLATRRSRAATVMIPYGGDEVTTADPAAIAHLGLTPDAYLVSIARIEPENNILTMVKAFSRKPRGKTLVVLGKLDPGNAYHASVKAAASAEVMFPGAIYDKTVVQALRFLARAYCHGHTVGGTNPSLVESLWCGNAVVGHDNAFNRWVAGPDQFYFTDETSCEQAMERALTDDAAIAKARACAWDRARTDLDWAKVLADYETAVLALGREHGLA